MSDPWRRPLYACILVAFFIAAPGGAGVAAEKLASIIIDDLGNSLDSGAAVLDIDANKTDKATAVRHRALVLMFKSSWKVHRPGTVDMLSEPARFLR